MSVKMVVVGVICIYRDFFYFNSRFLTGSVYNSCMFQFKGNVAAKHIQQWLKPSDHLFCKCPDVLSLSAQAF